MHPHLAGHLHHLQTMWENALERFQFDGVWLSAGVEQSYFEDDQGPKFKPNPHLAQWVDPQYLSAGSRLLLLPGKKPVLYLYTPSDYWHAPAPLPEGLAPMIEIQTFADTDELLKSCQQAVRSTQRLAHIGEGTPDNESLGESNPADMLDYVHFHRARKTAYELAAMRQASDVGVVGHVAAAKAFAQGGSEFDIHMAYLMASQQAEIDLPYGNIVAINEHASTLHYQFQDRLHQQPPRSLLIDAGGTYRGYASDITRTYVSTGEQHGLFATLLEHMETHQQKLIQSIKPGRSYADLHEQMHQQLAEILADLDIVSCSAQRAFSEGITEKFCPHGLGHLLGLQVHDVGGHLADEQGNPAPPPPNYPALRFTRAIETDQVFTIEPGIYFIPMLLKALAASSAPINWAVVEHLTPYGGIRIEDNVRVLPEGIENLTRDAFSRNAHV